MIRLVLVESLTHGVAGCLLGVLFSIWGITLLRNLLPSQLVTEARRTAMQVDGWVLLFAVAVTLITSLLSGLVPAFMSTRTSVQESLQDGGRSRSGSHLRNRFLKQLVRRPKLPPP